MAIFDSTSYRLYVRMSHKKHLLVEGRTDKQIFLILKDELARAGNIPIEFEIESVENFAGFSPGIGNRDKVESITFEMTSSEFEGKFVGFVDREYREFEFNTSIRDLINCHHVDDKLVWSRGHSIECYFFDFSILREPLRALCVSHNAVAALDIFSKVIESTLKMICALSLTACRDHENWERIIGCIDWKLLVLASGRSELNFDKWENALKRRGYNKQEVESIVNNFKKWYATINSSGRTIVRWICHGHIGLQILRQTYARCLYESCPTGSSKEPESEVHRAFLRVSQDHLANSIANEWASKVGKNSTDFPREVFDTLKIAV